MKSTLNRNGRAALVAAALASALLASCGGSGTQVEKFVATRVIAFGDESSVITPSTQLKYGVNGLALDASGAIVIECGINGLWVQSVAALWGLVFQECPGGFAAPVSRIRATNGAKVGDLSAQIDAQVSDGGFVKGDMVTVLLGVNDIIEQFEQYPGVSEAQVTANLDVIGADLATQVNRLATLGAKVLISTVPDMGYSPYATAHDGSAAMLSRMSTAFNNAMLGHLNNDGHKIGLILFDQYVISSAVNTAAGTGSYTNMTLGSCTVPLPLCTSATQTAGALLGPWFWADDRRIGPLPQANLGALAQTRASNNPF